MKDGFCNTKPSGKSCFQEFKCTPLSSNSLKQLFHFPPTYEVFHLNINKYLFLNMLLLLLSCFSLSDPVRPHRWQPPMSLGFSRQEHWSGLPCPSPTHESENESEAAQLCLTLRDPMDCSPPGSSIQGILQARVLERGAIAFSDIHANKYISILP